MKDSRQFGTSSSLSDERNTQIAHAISRHFVRENFKLTSNGEYRRRLGQLASELGIPENELHEFALAKLSRVLGEMFGWESCSIEGSTQRVGMMA